MKHRILKIKPMKKLLILLLLIQTNVFAQQQKNFPNAGFSINLSNNWDIKKSNDTHSPLFAIVKKNNLFLSIKLTDFVTTESPAFSKEEALQIKPQVINSLKQRGVTIYEINVIPGSFQGKRCFITNAVISDPTYLNGKSHHYNTIQLFHKKYLFVIATNIPNTKDTKTDLQFVSDQLKTIKFY